MKIAIVGTIDTPIRKDALGGTEMWTYSHAEKLKSIGHEVTLFANDESEFSGKLVKVVKQKELFESGKKGVFSNNKIFLFAVHEMIEVVQRQKEFDLIHVSSTNFQNFLPATSLIKCPIVVTIHSSNLEYDDAKMIFGYFPDVNYVFISNDFAKRWPKPKNFSIIHNGIDFNQFEFSNLAKDYYFWMGRVNPTKGVEDAVKFSRITKKKVFIAGPIRDQNYFDQKVKPYLNKNLIYLGSLGHKEKIKYYKSAKAFLMPIHWDEPFGLVAVEAMACGTPVLGYKRGALPEVVKEGIGGFLAETDDIKQLIKLADNIEGLDRRKVMEEAKKNFSIEKMVKGYLDLYQSLNRERL